MPWLSLPALARWLAWWRHPARCHGEPPSCPRCTQDLRAYVGQADWVRAFHLATAGGILTTYWQTCPYCKLEWQIEEKET